MISYTIMNNTINIDKSFLIKQNIKTKIDIKRMN